MRWIIGFTILFCCSGYANTALTEGAKAFELCKPRLIAATEKKQLDQQQVSSVVNALTFQAKVIEFDRRQPEFVQTFPNYFSKRVNTWRINKGREMLAKHKGFLQQLTHKYGVPAHYLLSFWGLETNFGSYKGKMPVLDSLATLACDPRRSSYFTQEFVVALELMQREALSADQMIGSWAGAMGHTQFMPSAYINYAIDGDGDGQINLWDSEQDALASAANFLANLGWKPGIRWGREVILNADFDYALTGRSNKQSVSAWQTKGLTRANGSPLGNSDILGYLVIPSGHTGPKFLVYENFRTIMRWNNSEFYAIAVGRLADRIAGGGELIAPLPELPTYSYVQIKQLQAYLNDLGFNVGKPDGILGPMTRKGIRSAQQKLNMTADGFPSLALMQKAGVTI